MNEIYVSVDIEADGPIPGDNSMLSIGSAAYDESESLLSTFSANILPLQAGQQNPITMEQATQSMGGATKRPGGTWQGHAPVLRMACKSVL